VGRFERDVVGAGRGDGEPSESVIPTVEFASLLRLARLPPAPEAVAGVAVVGLSDAIFGGGGGAALLLLLLLLLLFRRRHGADRPRIMEC